MMKEIGSLINIKKDVPSNKPSHLKEGVRPIIACIGTTNQFYQTNPALFNQILGDSHDVNYHGGSIYKNEKSKHRKKESYIISPVDNLGKFSGAYYNCIGIIAAGLELKTSNDTSFLSHQDPVYFLKNQYRKNIFRRDLNLALTEIKERSIEGTIDAVIFGGNYLEDPISQNNYVKSVKLVTKVVEKVLGFEPLIVTGPKDNIQKDDVYYNNRFLYIMKDNIGDGNVSVESYYPSNIEEQRRKW